MFPVGGVGPQIILLVRTGRPAGAILPSFVYVRGELRTRNWEGVPDRQERSIALFGVYLAEPHVRKDNLGHSLDTSLRFLQAICDRC